MSKYKDNKIKDNISQSWNIIIDKIEPGSRVLDVGCSSGYMAKVLQDKKDCKVWGIDIDQEDVTLAKNICQDAKVVNLDDKDWQDQVPWEGFDFVIFADVLEHIKEPGKVLRDTKKLLTKEGQVILSVPNIAHLSVRLSLLIGKFESQQQGIMDNTHLQYFTRDKISALVISAGYEINEVVPTLINRVPKKIIEDYLEKLGLTYTIQLRDEFKKEEANAYQYLIVAKNSNKDPKDIKYPKRIDIQVDTDKYINEVNHSLHRLSGDIEKRDDLIRSLQKDRDEYDRNLKIAINQRESQKHEIDSLNKNIDSLNKNIDSLNKNIEHIQQSFTNRLINKLRKLRNEKK